MVAAAYRELAAAGLVELRARAGAFLHRGLPTPQPREQPSTAWLADVFAAGIARGVPASELSTLLRRALGRDPVTVAVIASTVDQTVGICRELEQEVGLSASPVPRRRAAALGALHSTGRVPGGDAARDAARTSCS
jgi:hypothetical protein